MSSKSAGQEKRGGFGFVEGVAAGIGIPIFLVLKVVFVVLKAVLKVTGNLPKDE